MAQNKKSDSIWVLVRLGKARLWSSRVRRGVLDTRDSLRLLSWEAIVAWVVACCNLHCNLASSLWLQLRWLMNHASSSPLDAICDDAPDATCDDAGSNQWGNRNGNYNTDGHLGRVVRLVEIVLKIVLCIIAPLAMDCTSHSQEKERREKWQPHEALDLVTSLVVVVSPICKNFNLCQLQRQHKTFTHVRLEQI